jgi:DNA-binding LacI/PurR family transcriptional regulator
MATAAVDNLIGQISADVRSKGSVVLPMNLVLRETVTDLRTTPTL